MSAETQALRELLEAVYEALTVPDDDLTDRRLVDRALWARVTIRGALDEDPAELSWNVGYLRNKMSEEETATK
ncbi:hypothetical protein ACFV3F_09435 [Streptomyces sp. NPDC059717]|uniref:hypothetical protein n=1 Tax=Streptomyces sp. NPDC059717 TaxID=3346922 RepID=UPI00368EBE12